MISFSDYRDSIPNVFFSVGKCLNEELHVETQHFLGSVKHIPPTKAIMPGVYFDPDSDGYLHYKNDGSSVRLKSIESAEMFAESLKRSHNKNLQALDKKLSLYYHDATTNPTYAKHIEEYTTNSSGLNRKLLHGENLTDDESHHVMMLDDITNHTKTPEGIILYSGTSRSHANELMRKPVVHHPSFVSTSLSVNKAMDFASRNNGDLLQLHIPEKHKGVYVDHISDFAEREFLLPRGLNFRIHPDKEKVLITPTRTFRVHHATIEA